MHSILSAAGRLSIVVALVAAGGVLLSVGSASSQSVTPQSEDPVQHFIDCAGVLISAPDIHAANCLPSQVAPDGIKSLGTKTGGSDPCQYIRPTLAPSALFLSGDTSVEVLKVQDDCYEDGVIDDVLDDDDDDDVNTET